MIKKNKKEMQREREFKKEKQFQEKNVNKFKKGIEMKNFKKISSFEYKKSLKKVLNVFLFSSNTNGGTKGKIRVEQRLR